MLPSSYYKERERAKLQTRALKEMRQEVNPETGMPYLPARVDTWLGGYRGLFPDTRAPKTMYDQAAMLKPFRARYGDRTMASITAIEAQDWTLKHPCQVRQLMRAWNFAVLMQVVPLNIWKGLVKAPRTKEKRRAPTAEEYARILAASEVKGWDVFSRMIVIAAHTGVRRAGLIGVRRTDVDFNTGRMRVTEKGNKTRMVALLGPSKDALLEQFALRERHGWGGPRLAPVNGGPPVALVFVSEAPHSLMTGSRVKHSWAAVRGDFPHGWHSLRHYATTWMMSQGLDPLDVATQLGHIDAHGRPYARYVDQIYDHNRPDPEEALQRLVAGLSV